MFTAAVTALRSANDALDILMESGGDATAVLTTREAARRALALMGLSADEIAAL